MNLFMLTSLPHLPFRPTSINVLKGILKLLGFAQVPTFSVLSDPDQNKGAEGQSAPPLGCSFSSSLAFCSLTIRSIVLRRLWPVILDSLLFSAICSTSFLNRQHSTTYKDTLSVVKLFKGIYFRCVYILEPLKYYHAGWKAYYIPCPDHTTPTHYDSRSNCWSVRLKCRRSGRGHYQTA